MYSFYWFLIGVGLMGLLIIGVGLFWDGFENEQIGPIDIKTCRSHILGIRDSSE